jgi:hypothetical protein
VVGRLKEIVFDCEHPASLARFWAAMVDGYAVRPYDEAEIARLATLGLTPETDPTVMVDGPGATLCFQQVSSRRYDNNRLHLDLAVENRTTAIEAALALGASLLRTANGYSVLKDPEGNQFCLVGPT